MGQDLSRIEKAYDTAAKEYSDKFYDELEKKPKDREILSRFAAEIGNNNPVWDLGCGPGQTTKYLKDLGVEISGLDLSKKSLEQAGKNFPDILFCKAILFLYLRKKRQNWPSSTDSKNINNVSGKRDDVLVWHIKSSIMRIICLYQYWKNNITNV